MSRPAWLSGTIATVILVAVVALVLLALSGLKSCQAQRAERRLDGSVSSDLQGRGQATTIETVRAAQEANATQRAADAAADNEARNDPTARNQLSEATRARIAAADKRLCAKANCN